MKKPLRRLAWNMKQQSSVIPKKILLPVDLSEGSEEALTYAVEIARVFGAKLHLLHVVGLPAMGVPEMGVAYSTTMMDGMFTDDMRALERMLAKHVGECELGPPLIKSGDPRAAINETAKEARRRSDRDGDTRTARHLARAARQRHRERGAHRTLPRAHREAAPRHRRKGRVISRAAMIANQLRGRGIRSLAVLDAFAAIPREAFVDPRLRELAYADRPLPIGYGQTISQPYIVALTAELLAPHGNEQVLEIGTGSGYAAAILGRLARRVDTIERIPELAEHARATLAALGIRNVHVHCADGSLGWPPNGPYDAIAVAASAPSPPPSLRAQLALGGRLVMPVVPDRNQRLVRIVRDAEGVFDERELTPVTFVPLVGAEGWPAR